MAIFTEPFFTKRTSPSTTLNSQLSTLNLKKYFLRFEGVGTYATITVNGKDFGRHPIGRTTLTLDVTDELKQGVNRLEVKAEHPEMIADMPWVCGGCSSEWGFSEGSPTVRYLPSCGIGSNG